MSGRVGPRLEAVLADLGLPTPSAPERSAEQVRTGVDGGAPLTVVLVVEEGVDLRALEDAGLHLAQGAPPVVTGVVLPPRATAVADVEGVRSIDLEAAEFPEVNSSVPATRATHVRTGSMGLTGAGVVVGVVDSGIDIYHHAFRKPDGTTRLVALLDTARPFSIQAVGSPTGGTFTLRWKPPARPGGGSAAAQVTAALPVTATVQQVRAALEALDAIEPGDVLATGGPLPGSPILVDFAGRYLRQDVKALEVSNTGVTPATAAVVVERGREYTAQQINDALAVPEAPFGSFDASGHGTHVMGIAAGDGSQPARCHGADYYVGVAPEADLVAVKTTFATAATMRGVDFVFQQAGTRPAVVNLSLGGQSGARDGSAADELHYDRLLRDNPTGRTIVVSAGNSGRLFDHDRRADLQASSGNGVHSRKTVPANGSATMTVVIAPQDRQDDFFWFWYAGNGRLSLQVTTPRGVALPAPLAPAGPLLETTLAKHKMIATNHLSVTTTGRHRITLRLSPVEDGTVAAGRWVFRLTETAGHETVVDCWVDDDEEDPHPRFIDTDQDRTHTLTTPGTAHNVITVANYDHRDNTLAESSSRGPTTDTRAADRTKPDLAAPGTGITAANTNARSTGISGCCQDFYVAKSGTSMAAPHVTGIAALLFQRNGNLTWEQVRAHLRTAADPPNPGMAGTLPDAEWGAGIVNAEVAAAAVPPSVHAAPSPQLSAEAPRVPAIVPAPSLHGPDPAALLLRELRRAVTSTPGGQLAAALMSNHVDEVRRLVEQERRVTVTWHRMGGPDLVRHVLQAAPGAQTRPSDVPLLPERLGDRPLAEGLARLLDALEAAGSERLRADVARYRPLVLSLPGRTWDDISEFPSVG